MAHRLKSKFDSRGRPGVESLWGQRTSGTKKFGDKDVRGQRCSGTKMFGDKRGIGKLGEPLGTKKFGDKEDRGQKSLGTSVWQKSLPENIRKKE